MYNKLFTKILDSSIWLETDATRIVWLTLIAAMDEQGFVQFASVANLAHRARVTEEGANEAVRRLESPDTNSSDPDHEGRRIERVPGGWMILNAEKYRELVTRAVAQEKTRQRVARFRAKHAVTNGNAYVTPANATVTPSEAVTDTESYCPNPAAQLPEEVIYQMYPRKVGKTAALKAIRACLKKLSRDQLLIRTTQYREAVELWSPHDLQFIPHPATWFNRGSYDDDPETWKRHAKPNPHQRANDRSYSQVDDYSAYKPRPDQLEAGA